MSNFDEQQPVGAVDAVGQDTSAPTTDAAMTVSGEELVLGTTWRASGRVRLVKHVVTEIQTFEVEVSREELRVEREPADGTGGPVGAPEPWEPLEIILNREEVVNVQKTVVPSDRVTVYKDIVTEQRRIETDLRHEEVVLEEESAPGSSGRSMLGS